MKTLVRAALSLSVCGIFHGISAAQSAPTSTARQQQYVLTTATSKNLDAQLADTLRRLTRVRLERAIQINSKVPGTYSAEDFKIIKAELAAIDKNEARNGEVIDWFSTLIGMAKVSKTAAEAEWESVSALRQQPIQTISDLNFEIVRLRSQLANIDLQRGLMAAKGTQEERQNWALLYLTLEIQGLKDQVRILDERTR